MPTRLRTVVGRRVLAEALADFAYVAIDSRRFRGADAPVKLGHVQSELEAYWQDAQTQALSAARGEPNVAPREPSPPRELIDGAELYAKLAEAELGADAAKQQRLAAFRRYVTHAYLSVKMGARLLPPGIARGARFGGAPSSTTVDDFARRADELSAACAALGLRAAGAVETLWTFKLDELFDQAQGVLVATEDGYLDLLRYALKRDDIRAETAAALQSAIDGPWLFSVFLGENLRAATERTLLDLALPKTIRMEIVTPSSGESEAGDAQMYEIEIPDNVVLRLQLGRGLATYERWLHEVGLASYRTLLSPDLPWVYRRLGDGITSESYGLFFASLLLEPLWVKRHLNVSAAVARDAARMAAFAQVAEMRWCAVQVLALSSLWQGTSGLRVAADLQARLSAAMHVAVDARQAIEGVDVLGSACLTLGSYARHEALRTHALACFNEDYFRNPATGAWLAEPQKLPLLATLADAVSWRLATMGA